MCVAGYAGADLQALCTGAVMAAVRRSCPEVLLDPRLEQGMPLQATAAAAACPGDAAGQQESDGAQSAQHEASAALSGNRSFSSASDGSGQAAQQPQSQQAEHASEAADAHGTASQPAAATLDGAKAYADAPHERASSLSEAAAPSGSKDALRPASPSQGPGAQPEGRPPAEMLSPLEALEVRACDWRQALASAPEACARRDGMAALSAASARVLPARLGTALLPACASALQVLSHALACAIPSVGVRVKANTDSFA